MKRIGIVGASTGENSFGTAKTYLTWITKVLGGLPVILAPSDTIDESLDLVIMPGGMDVNPLRYGEVPEFYTSHQDVMKQFFADKNFPMYIDAGIPVFGICLGFQMIGVHFGSKLLQNIPEHSEQERGKESHKVTITNYILDSFGLDANKKEHKLLGVNSHHHQAITRSRMSKDLIATAVARNSLEEGDSIVEGFIHKELPIGGVQWHPEEWYDWFSLALVNEVMIRAGRKRVVDSDKMPPDF